MCHIYLQKLEPDTKKINSTKSVLHQLNDDPPLPQLQKNWLPLGPWTVQAAKEEKDNNCNIIRI